MKKVLLLSVLLITAISCEKEGGEDDKQIEKYVDPESYTILIGMKYENVLSSDIGTIKKKTEESDYAIINTIIETEESPFTGNFYFDTNYKLEDIILSQSKYLEINQYDETFALFKANTDRAFAKYGEPLKIAYMPKSAILEVDEHIIKNGYNSFWNNTHIKNSKDYKIYFYWSIGGQSVEYAFFKGSNIYQEFRIIIES